MIWDILIGLSLGMVVIGVLEYLFKNKFRRLPTDAEYKAKELELKKRAAGWN